MAVLHQFTPGAPLCFATLSLLTRYGACSAGGGGGCSAATSSTGVSLAFWSEGFASSAATKIPRLPWLAWHGVRLQMPGQCGVPSPQGRSSTQTKVTETKVHPTPSVPSHRRQAPGAGAWQHVMPPKSPLLLRTAFWTRVGFFEHAAPWKREDMLFTVFTIYSI